MNTRDVNNLLRQSDGSNNSEENNKERPGEGLPSREVNNKSHPAPKPFISEILAARYANVDTTTNQIDGYNRNGVPYHVLPAGYPIDPPRGRRIR